MISFLMMICRSLQQKKDAVKFLPLLEKHPDFKRSIWVVPVKAVLSTECYQILKSTIAKA